MPVLPPKVEGSTPSEIGRGRGRDRSGASGFDPPLDRPLDRPPDLQEPDEQPRGRRVRWFVAAALALSLLGVGTWAALRTLGADDATAPPGGGQSLESAALDGSYAMTMTLVSYRNGPQLLDLWGADANERQIGRTWPQENWIFSSSCYPQSCDAEVTVEGRGLKTWNLTKDGREYTGLDIGAGCKQAPVTRAVHFTVSDADMVNDVYTATSVEGRLTIDVTCEGFDAAEHAEFSLSGTLNPA
jgi:hypothetical protein